MSDDVKRLAAYAGSALAKWVVCALAGYGGLGMWLAGETAKHRFSVRAQEIITTSIAAATRKSSASEYFCTHARKPGAQAGIAAELQRLEEEDRQLQIQIEECPTGYENAILQLRRKQCIEAQAALTKRQRQINRRSERPQTLPAISQQLASTEADLRRLPYEAARQSTLLLPEMINRSNADGPTATIGGHRPGF